MEVYVNYAVRGGLIFMHVRNIAKETISLVTSVCQSVRPSAWDDSALNARIFTKFGIWVFLEYISIKFKFN
jgi:hypothetical protein